MCYLSCPRPSPTLIPVPDRFPQKRHEKQQQIKVSSSLDIDVCKCWCGASALYAASRLCCAQEANRRLEQEQYRELSRKLAHKVSRSPRAEPPSAGCHAARCRPAVGLHGVGCGGAQTEKQQELLSARKKEEKDKFEAQTTAR
jgi:hypothetical protein